MAILLLKSQFVVTGEDRTECIIFNTYSCRFSPPRTWRFERVRPLRPDFDNNSKQF